MAKNTLLALPKVLKDRTALHTNIDDKLIYPSIKVMQELYIKPITGSFLFDKLQSDIDANDLTGDYLELVTEYILDPLAYYVLADLTDTLSFQFFNNGVGNINTDKQQQLDKQGLFQLKDKYTNYANTFAERLKLYLQEDNGVKFPEFVQKSNAKDNIQPQSETFRMPIFIDDSFRYKKDEYSLR